MFACFVVSMLGCTVGCRLRHQDVYMRAEATQPQPGKCSAWGIHVPIKYLCGMCICKCHVSN